jgi:protein-S-isoprenylcysteine O-methyltransferase Ste14
LVIYEGTLAAGLFIAAGRLDLPWFWAVLAVHAAWMIVGFCTIDPGLLRERLKPGPGGQDRRLRILLVPFYMAHLIVAGFDVGRYGWSGTVPESLHALGLVAFAAGMGLSIRAMIVNRYFSPVVRIQQERGHQLVSDGPYRFVRHPGYVGILLSSLGSGIALGSWWSLVPLVPVAILILRRTAIEDRFLRKELEEYAAYAERVRYRLVPGVW